ncbi:N-acetyltransferase family protein [Lachnospiraceae bacterium C1.1]|nr:N-acetyltransferase family protein [Lachnospiraceae bacterium C1.1]
MNIRSAALSDTERLLEIYAYYVKETAISFEYDVPSIEEFKDRISERLGKYPYLVAEDNGKIVGYSYASPFVGRTAYNHCCEMTIYLDHELSGHGYGRALYEEMEKELKAMGIINLYSCIGDPIVEDEYLTKNSENFHRHMGYEKVGDFHKCGYKFGRWYNMIWMEKIIGEHKK